MEVFEHFAGAAGSSSIGRPLSEGAQTAFVNLYARLAATCPGESCERRADCLLLVDGSPKGFDSAEGKLRFLRMKARTEGRRARTPRGNDLLVGGHARLVGDERLLDGAGSGHPEDPAYDALAVEDRLTERLAEIRRRLEALDLEGVRGGHQAVAVAVSVVARLIERTDAEPLPPTDEERREEVRVLMSQVWPDVEDGKPATVRKRQSRVREVMRDIFGRIDGGWLAEHWVPFEDTKAR